MTAEPVTAALARRKSAGVAINIGAGYTGFMTSESRFLPCESGFLRGKSDVGVDGVAPFAVDFRACLPRRCAMPGAISRESSAQMVRKERVRRACGPGF